MTKRVTIACPEAYISAANQLSLALGEGMGDLYTFGIATWDDASNNHYSAASAPREQSWISSLTAPLSRPAWDTNNDIDMTAAATAQALLEIWEYDENETPPLANPTKITAYVDMDGIAALTAMGLTKQQTEV